MQKVKQDYEIMRLQTFFICRMWSKKLPKDINKFMPLNFDSNTNKGETTKAEIKKIKWDNLNKIIKNGKE